METYVNRAHWSFNCIGFVSSRFSYNDLFSLDTSWTGKEWGDQEWERLSSGRTWLHEKQRAATSHLKLCTLTNTALYATYLPHADNNWKDRTERGAPFRSHSNRKRTCFVIYSKRAWHFFLRYQKCLLNYQLVVWFGGQTSVPIFISCVYFHAIRIHVQVMCWVAA